MYTLKLVCVALVFLYMLTAVVCGMIEAYRLKKGYSEQKEESPCRYVPMRKPTSN